MENELNELIRLTKKNEELIYILVNKSEYLKSLGEDKVPNFSILTEEDSKRVADLMIVKDKISILSNVICVIASVFLTLSLSKMK